MKGVALLLLTYLRCPAFSMSTKKVITAFETSDLNFTFSELLNQQELHVIFRVGCGKIATPRTKSYSGDTHCSWRKSFTVRTDFYASDLQATVCIKT